MNDDAARLLDSSKLILKRSAARLKRIREILRAKKLVLFSEEAVRARGWNCRPAARRCKSERLRSVPVVRADQLLSLKVWARAVPSNQKRERLHSMTVISLAPPPENRTEFGLVSLPEGFGIYKIPSGLSRYSIMIVYLICAWFEVMLWDENHRLEVGELASWFRIS